MTVVVHRWAPGLLLLFCAYVCSTITRAQDVVRAEQLPLEDLSLLFFPVSRARSLSVVPAVTSRSFTVTHRDRNPFQVTTERHLNDLSAVILPTSHSGSSGAALASSQEKTNADFVFGSNLSGSKPPVRTIVSNQISPPSPSSFSSSSNHGRTIVSNQVLPPSSSSSSNILPNQLFHPSFPSTSSSSNILPNQLFHPSSSSSSSNLHPSSKQGRTIVTKPTIRRGNTVATIRFRVPDRMSGNRRNLKHLRENVYPALFGFLQAPSGGSRTPKVKRAHTEAATSLRGTSPIGLLYGLW